MHPQEWPWSLLYQTILFLGDGVSGVSETAHIDSGGVRCCFGRRPRFRDQYELRIPGALKCCATLCSGVHDS